MSMDNNEIERGSLMTPRLIVGRNVYRIENQRIRELIARIEESKNVQAQLA